MKYRSILTTLAMIFCLAALAQAGNVVVIVNPASSVAEATAAEISKVFMGKANAVGGTAVVAVDQSGDAEARADFCDKIMGRTVKKVTDYWKKRVFAGKGEPPDEVGADAKVIAHVAANPDAIGYVSAGALTDKVKAIAVDGKVEW